MDHAESERKQEILDDIMDNATRNPISGKEMDRLIELLDKPSTSAAISLTENLSGRIDADARTPHRRIKRKRGYVR